MTDEWKVALDFARKCVGWPNATCRYGIVARDAHSDASFNASSWEAVWPYIREFLGTRYRIQMNRDRSTNARWRVAIGVQDISGASPDIVEVFDDDQAYALMVACTRAVETLNPGIYEQWTRNAHPDVSMASTGPSPK